MKFRKVVAGAVIVQGLALLDLSAANANVILSYTGNDFNTFSPTLGSPGQPYTGTDMVTASITLANPLGDNLNLAPVIPLAFSLSDGVQTITNTTQHLNEIGLEFSTNASGTIIGWFVFAELSSPLNNIQTDGNFLGATFDRAFFNNGHAEASLDSDPGAWTVMTVAAAPEPPTASVLGVGLLGLGLLWWRRRQKLDLTQ